MLHVPLEATITPQRSTHLYNHVAMQAQKPDHCIHILCKTLATCSDLHPYHGREAGIKPGTIVGHEFVGVVEQVGSKVGKPGAHVHTRHRRALSMCQWQRSEAAVRPTLATLVASRHQKQLRCHMCKMRSC